MVVLIWGKKDHGNGKGGEDGERGLMWSQSYLGAEPSLDLRTRKGTLNYSIRAVRGSQWSCCVIKEMWEKHGRRAVSRAEALRTTVWIRDSRNSYSRNFISIMFPYS